MAVPPQPALWGIPCAATDFELSADNAEAHLSETVYRMLFLFFSGCGTFAWYMVRDLRDGTEA